MATTIAWEPGLRCGYVPCGAEFGVGEEIIYWYGHRMHPGCARADAAVRRADAGEGGDVLAVARRCLGSGERIVLTRGQLRALIGLAKGVPGFAPVHRPDAGRGPQRWYGRLPGWAASRVDAGLSAPEVAGLWSDFLDIGRMPPLRRADLAAIVAVISDL